VMRTLFVGVLLCAAGTGAFEWMIRLDYEATQARTTTMNIIVVGEAFYLFNCRSLVRPLGRRDLFSNPWVYGGVAIMVGLQVLVTHVSIFHVLLETASLDLFAWSLVAATGVSLFVL